jgi:protein gp88
MKHHQLVCISQGNRKLGCVMNISTTPGRCCPKGVPCASDGCYANKAYWLYPGTRAAWRRNEQLAKHHPDDYFGQIAAQVAQAKPRLFRWHVAGDILNADYLRGMCRIAAANPHTHFWAFTKNFDVVNRYEDHEAVPSNLVIVFSAWPGMSFSNPHGHRVAWMQDGTETRVPEDAIRCPGNCETCGLCYELSGIGRDVVFHKH